MSVSDRELRILSELVYLDLNPYIGVGGPVGKLKNGEIEKLLLERLKKDGSSLDRKNITNILSKWELVYSIQYKLNENLIQNMNNPLLDAFMFKSLYGNQLVMAFRGSNRRNKMQWKEDMKVNLATTFIEELRDPTKVSQLDQAIAFVTLIVKKMGFPNCNGCNNNHCMQTEGFYKGKVCDYSNYVYLTGHSKGGGIAQQLVYVLETFYKLKVSGVTFAATPVERMSTIIHELKENHVLYPEYDLRLSSCINYLVKRDRVLIGLRLNRFKKMFYQLNKVRKRQNNIGDKKKIPSCKKIKFPRLWEAEYIGQKYIISPQKSDYFGKPTIRTMRHSLSFFDEHFDDNGNIITKE